VIERRLQQRWDVEQRNAATAMLDSHPRLAELDAWIAQWWERWEPSCPVERDAGWPELALTALRASRPVDDDTARAAETTIVTRGVDSPNNSSGTLLLARVLGRVTGSGTPTADRFDHAERIAVRRSSWAAAFFDAFAVAARGGDIEAWRACLADFPCTLELCCGTLAGDNSQAVKQLAEAQAARVAAGETAALWDFREPREIEPKTAVVMRLRALFALSPAAATAALARIPSAPLRYVYRYFLGIGDDVDAIIAAIEAAPLLWSRGQWTGNADAALFIDYATNFGVRLRGAVERDGPPGAAETLRTQELPQLFRRVVAAVLSREDGRNLAIDYAAQLVHKTSWSKNPHDLPVERVALAEYLDGLRGANVTAREVLRFARSRLTPSAQWHRRACFRSVAGYLVTDETTARNTWAELVALLLEAGDDDITMTFECAALSTHLFGGFGYALAKTQSPVDAWRAAWRELFPRRERARFGVHLGRGLRSSVYLAFAGLAALEPLIAQNLSDRARPLLADVTDALLAVAGAPRMTDLSLKMHQILALPWAFAWLVDGAAWTIRLRTWGDVFNVDPAACLFAADYLIRNGVPRTMVLDQMTAAGCDPIAVGNRLIEWMIAKGFGTVIEDVEMTKLLASVAGA
jgi:hypothetical protein